MAVRLAIGGTPSHVLRLIVRHVSWVVGIGMIVGLAGALTAAQSRRTLLFGIEPWDPFSQSVTIAVLGAVAIAAAWIPARRAMRVDPARVLRGDWLFPVRLNNIGGGVTMRPWRVYAAGLAER